MSHPRSRTTTAPKRGWGRKLVDWMRYKDKNKWLKDMRASMSLTVSIIATITFQSALNPPGGVMQADFNDFKDVLKNCTSNETLPCPGKAILAVVYPDAYHPFLVCNTICFIASLSVCLLLVSGLYLNHAFITWILLLSMWITITSLALTYLFGAIMVTPSSYVFSSAFTSVFGRVVLSWIALLAILGFLLLIRFVAWGVEHIKSCNRSSATSTINKTTSISGA